MIDDEVYRELQNMEAEARKLHEMLFDLCRVVESQGRDLPVKQREVVYGC